MYILPVPPPPTFFAILQPLSHPSPTTTIHTKPIVRINNRKNTTTRTPHKKTPTFIEHQQLTEKIWRSAPTFFSFPPSSGTKIGGLLSYFFFRSGAQFSFGALFVLRGWPTVTSLIFPVRVHCYTLRRPVLRCTFYSLLRSATVWPALHSLHGMPRAVCDFD